MKIKTSWAGPVAVSLLLHIVLIVVISSKLSSDIPEYIKEQPISVEFSQQSSPVVNKSAVIANKPKTSIKSKPETETKILEPAAELKNEPTQIQQPVDNKQLPDLKIEQSAVTIQPLNKLTRPPSFLKKIEPVYPVSEQRAGSQANVVAEVTIDEKGNVLNIKIVRSSGAAFDNAVLDALKKSIFTPGYIEKEPVAVRVLVPFRFNLK